MTDWQLIDREVKSWLKEARQQIMLQMQQDFKVTTKTSCTDLVTAVDVSIEQFYTKQIKHCFPTAEILGEECQQACLKTKQGLLWIIDPIDGTMNFVKQGKDFASMLAVYEDGQPKLGYILDVVADKLYWGGPECGVFCNEKQLKTPPNQTLAAGLVGISCPMLLNNYKNLVEVAKQSSGVRIYGSAGIQYIHVLTGKCVAYVSHLCPWDFAAGKILAQTLGLDVKTIDGKAIDMLSSTDVLVATKNAQRKIAAIIASESKL